MNPTSAQKRIAFGYNRNNGHIAINEGQAALVKLIYEWYAEGRGLGEIKEMLEELHAPSPQNKPTWGKQALSNILSTLITSDRMSIRQLLLRSCSTWCRLSNLPKLPGIPVAVNNMSI